MRQLGQGPGGPGGVGNRGRQCGRVRLEVHGHPERGGKQPSSTSTTRAGSDVEQIVAVVSAVHERPARPSPLSTSLTFAWRGLLKIKHVPEQLLDVTLFRC